MLEMIQSGLLSLLVSAFVRPLLSRLDKNALPKYEGTVSLPGLSANVEVVWDAYAVPHVYAENEHDLFFAQGYLHAQERLWQMDMSRRLQTDLRELAVIESKAKSAADRLIGWNGRCHEQSVEAAIYHVFYHRLLNNLLLPVLGEELFFGYIEIFNQSLVPVDRILKSPNSIWFASCSRIRLVARSLEEALEDLSQALGPDLARWQWGAIHTLSLNHHLTRVPFLRRCLSLGPFPSFGDNTTVNLGFYRQSDPYRHTVGASLRFIIDFGDWHNSGFVLPSGQSGHPSSPHYGDQTKLWHNGRLIHLSTAPPAARGLILMPQPAEATPQ